MMDTKENPRQDKEEQKKQFLRDLISFLKVSGVIVIIFCLLSATRSLPTDQPKSARQSSTLQTCRTIALAMYAFANTHEGRYPVGKTSTEVFQQLIDGKYVSDASLFYVNLPGKVRSMSTRLKPENVAYDVTCPVDPSAHEKLPLVFLTGFKVTYAPGASAVPIPLPARTWSEWWNDVDHRQDYLGVAYVNNSARVLLPDANGAIANFIPADLEMKDQSYRQLTP